MPKRKDKTKSKYRIKSKNNKNKNKNSINIKIIGGQGGGGGGSSSHIPYHAPHHQDIDYDRIRNIFYQPNPRSPLTQESVNPPPVHQAVDITPNVSTYQNMQLTPNESKSRQTTPQEMRTARSRPFDYDDFTNVGQFSAQTAPIVNPMYARKKDDDDEFDINDWQTTSISSTFNTPAIYKEPTQFVLSKEELQNVKLKSIHERYKDTEPVKNEKRKKEKNDLSNASYKEFKELSAHCKDLGNNKKYKNNIDDKKKMVDFINKNTKTG
jgi:hypothetical protein